MFQSDLELKRLNGEVPALIKENIHPEETIESFEIICPSNADEVLEISRQVLTALLKNHHKANLNEHDWEKLLDENFVKRCEPHPTPEE